MISSPRRLFCFLVIGLEISGTREVRAWEIAKDPKLDTRAFPTPPRPFPFHNRFSGARNATANQATLFGNSGPGPNDGFFPQGAYKDFLAAESSNGFFRFESRYIHEALGNGADGSRFAANLLFCPTKPTSADFEAFGCRIADDAVADSDLKALPGWANARRRWVDGDDAHVHDEHAELTRQAALIAGLPAVLNETFWLRYPGLNAFIASPVEYYRGLEREKGWLVGPRWLPQDIQNVDSSTLRPVKLFELAQLPDQAFAIWDWAASQELCPLERSPGFPEMDPDEGNTRCHDYATRIGLLNAPHFAPQNKSVYEYYHGLALASMARCVSLSVALAPNYQYEDVEAGWALTASRNHTEVHECEREALVYEMFAQHFMQDSWSSGHMWHRWGFAEPNQFPYYLDDAHGLSWDDRDHVPTENVAGRRALVAGVTAGFVGMVHGVKAVASKALPKKKGLVGDIAVWAGLTDDPLCAPDYFDLGAGQTGHVMWADSNLNVYPGIGDLFGETVLMGGDMNFLEEADRLRMCTGKSLREVYDAGPHAHGEPTPFQGRWDFMNFDIEQECWSQRATNSSMVGAVLPAPLSYAPVEAIGHSLGVSLFGTANEAIFGLYSTDNAAAMPNDVDRKKFYKSVQDRMIYDQISVADAYLDNAITNPAGNYKQARDPLGTQSAKGRRKTVYDGSVDIRFLGVAPARPLTAHPPARFMDPPSILENGGGDAPSELLHRMFWRAHPEETCEVEGLVGRLRDQCIAGAESPGGAPEACTRCVELAELQMPTCSLWGTDVDFIPSKCTALGYENLGGIDPLYYVPPQSGGQASCLDNKTALVPPYFAAFHFCTGTDPFSASPSGQADWAPLAGARGISSQTIQTFECSQFEDWWALNGPFDHDGILSHQEIKSGRVRYAYGVAESVPHAVNWLPPIVTALAVDVSTQILDQHDFCMEPNRHFRVEQSSDLKIAALIDPLPLWDNEGQGVRAFSLDGRSPEPHPIDFEYCGIIQRATYANRSCADTLLRLGLGPASLDQIGLPQNPFSGFQANTAVGNGEERCSVIEARRLKSSCAEGECNANGLCSAAAPPSIVFAR